MATVENPYQPPVIEAPTVANNRGMVLASKGQRFGTFVIDYLCYLAISFAVGVFIVVVFGEEAIDAIDKVPDFIVGIPIFMAYYCFFEGIWGRTPGKFLIGTKVVDEEGDPLSFAQVVGRSACRLIPFEAFSFFGERGWHDSISHTCVVQTRNI